MKTLTPVQQKFILHWGKMGTQWGINRTVAQIHALLYISPKPLDAETIAQTLSVARSNVSTSLWELQGWGIIKTVQALGDRRDHYESIQRRLGDVSHRAGREKKREIDPTLELLRDCVAEAKGEDRVTRERLAGLLEFFESMTVWSRPDSPAADSRRPEIRENGGQDFKADRTGRGLTAFWPSISVITEINEYEPNYKRHRGLCGAGAGSLAARGCPWRCCRRLRCILAAGLRAGF